ncbi:MAG: alpha/beta fold hydrolase [Sphingomonadaceae bacterium]
MIPAGPTTQRYFSQRLRLQYVDWGNHDKPPLLLVHGGRDHSRSWDWTARALCQDWHVIAMDHRGHGDSEWVSDGNYLVSDMVYDLAQLVHQRMLAPVTIVAHSLGGGVSLGFAGAFPDQVRKMVAIEPWGLSPEMAPDRGQKSYPERIRHWVEAKRNGASRLPTRYTSIEEALARMQEVNHFLSDEQALHLTIHGVNQNEDGTYSWKFDPGLYTQPVDPTDHAMFQQLWQSVTCPLMLLYGANSFVTNPQKTGWIDYLPDAQMVEFEHAGHWLHHDQFARFISVLKGFL